MPCYGHVTLTFLNAILFRFGVVCSKSDQIMGESLLWLSNLLPSPIRVYYSPKTVLVINMDGFVFTVRQALA